MQNYPKYGEESEQVRQMQIALNKAGIIPKLSPDGIFWKLTQASLRLFQLQNSMHVTGSVNAETWAKLFPEEQSETIDTAPVPASNAGKSLFTSKRALDVYGKPGGTKTQGKYMEVWEVPDDIEKSFEHVRFSATGTIGFPKKIFINKDFRPQLEKALRNVIMRGLAKEMKTWDGCYQLRAKVANPSSYSMHAWGLAVDLNAAENGYNKPVKLSNAFLKCFTDCHIISGAFWSVKDGMHFELAG